MNSENSHTARPYRSKKRRPCDLCRRRKHACHLESSPPCRSCRELGADCTFDEPPRKRLALDDGFSRDAPVPAASDVRHPDQEPTRRASFLNNDHSNLHLNQQMRFPDLDMSLLQSLAFPSQHGFWSTESPRYNINHGYATAAPDLDLDHQRDMPRNAVPQPSPRSQSELLSRDASGLLEDGLLPRIRSRERQIYQVLRDQRNPNNATNVALEFSGTRSLEFDLRGRQLSSQFCGLSGESDPSLLQHIRFSEEGVRQLGRLQYRVMAPFRSGVKRLGKQIPVHFMTCQISPSSSQGEIICNEERATLNAIILPEHGVRLVALFLRYVHPSYPIVSRSQLGIKTRNLIPPTKYLDHHPCSLLAAIYALAGPFRRYDPVLCVSMAGTEFPTVKLWQIVSTAIAQESSAPHLHHLQTILLYLQQSAPGETVGDTADDLGQWPLLGRAVQIATQLGLHVDCLTWAIPAWERRLRRRVWWVLFTESTWRSLLLGLPPPISDGQWNVQELAEEDFEIDHFRCPPEETAYNIAHSTDKCVYCHLGYDFRFLASLSIIANDVLKCLFSLGATMALSKDFAACFKIAQPLLQRLDDWKTQLPAQYVVDQPDVSATRSYIHSSSGTNLKLAHITLQAMIYRSLLRSLQEYELDVGVENVGTDLSERSQSPNAYTAPPAETLQSQSERDTIHIQGICQGALDTAKKSLIFTQKLGSYEHNSFSCKWSSLCYASLSNFKVLLLIEAMNPAFASTALRILIEWMVTLREQCAMFYNMRLGMLRLDSLFQNGLDELFTYSSHVRDLIEDELPRVDNYNQLPN